MTLVIILPLNSHAEEEWEFKKNKNEITVYTRPVTGSNFKEFKAVMKVKSRLKKLSAMLMDPVTMAEWMYMTESIHVIEQINSSESIRHVTSNFPWPAKDRDLIIKTQLSQKSDLSVHMIINSLKNHPTVKQAPKTIRAEHLKSAVRYFPEDDGLIRIEYTAHYEPGGALPSYLYNLLLIDTPFKTFRALKKWIKKDIYDESKVSFISEIKIATSNNNAIQNH